MSLHRYEIGTNIYEDGVTAYPVKGEPVTVNGSPMVALAHEVIVPAAGWYETENEARLRAASKVEDLGLRLLAQARRLRIESEISREASA